MMVAYDRFIMLSFTYGKAHAPRPKQDMMTANIGHFGMDCRSPGTWTRSVRSESVR